jgi:UDPglucose 6-dehydrogenase
MLVGIIGIGFVGSAIEKSFAIKNIQTVKYDKYKRIGELVDCLKTDICFLCLPTQYNEIKDGYDKDAIYETCEYMTNNNYTGILVIKSTIECGTIEDLSNKYINLKLVHNPEFLSAKTAFEDFHNQNHIVLGFNKLFKEEDRITMIEFYKNNYPRAEISICTDKEAESMKLFCNSFYATKIQFFNELYLLCNKMNTNYENIKLLMLKNNWINPMHTNVPGSDGELSFGGMCLPKDIKALRSLMIKKESTCKIINAVIEEQQDMRKKDSI